MGTGFAARPVILRQWSILGVLDDGGHAVLTFVIGNRGCPDLSLIVKVNPRSNPVHIVSVAIVGGMTPYSHVTADTLPHIIRDLAETKTREMFPQVVLGRH